MTHKHILATVLIAATATLGACTSAGPATDEAPVGVNRPTTTAPAAETPAPAAETPTPTPTDDGTAKFGKTYTWTDGLSVTVTTPKAYKPGEYAAGADQFKSSVVFTVTVVNKTGKPYDPSIFMLSMQSGNEEASQIFDSQNNLGGSPSTKILNGREAKFKAAFNVANPKDLVLEVTPGFEYDSVIFTG